MTTRMLIDARHREETRVAVVQNNRIEEFDFESAERKQLKGNIYLAKVTRVEPSLQAAFIDYGGNRHGFLAFSEIHPDYYQIPKEDRDALLREEAEHAAEEAALRAEQDGDDDDHDADDDGFEEEADEHDEVEGEEGEDPPAPPRRRVPGDEAVEELRERRMNLRRRYKIQDVIRRRQVLLVQIVKEERGNKGAALTTYLSLAGRYCVLMPNTSHGGGISRKISNAGDRKRLKSIMADMQLPPSMGCIVRTAGLQRTKVEIKRDFDYLARLWDGIREETLKSAAPALVYGDSDLIKRAIRDIYNRDIDEVIVEGEDGYRHAREFMKLLMPSHARKVKHYADAVPLYQRAGVEEQLSAMYHPVVQLRSGGYLVINPTEALVSIDINSGRSTREHNIEQTATATNLEAAAEIARQLRLRDMAGLVVIDFIDMDNNANVRKVEKCMKDALKNDRARIQVGQISSFGLMEMSRQRLRTGVLEASTRACPHCEGTGLVRTASSAGLSALRLIEDEAARGRGSVLTLRASQEATIYVLNRKRADIAEIEDRYGVLVEIVPDREEEGARMSVEYSGPPPEHAPKIEALITEDDEEDFPEEIELDEEELESDDEPADEAGEPRGASRREQGDDARGKKRRRRRGRRGRARPDGGEGEAAENEGGEAQADKAADELADGDSELAADDGVEEMASASEPTGESEGRRRRGRRGRRGGRRDEAGTPVPVDVAESDEAASDEVIERVSDEPPHADDEPAAVADLAEAPEAAKPEIVGEASTTRRRPRARSAAPAAVASDDAAGDEAPKRGRGRPRKAVTEPVEGEPTSDVEGPPIDLVDDATVATAEETEKPKRSRRKKADAPAAEAVDATVEHAEGAVVADGSDDAVAPPAPTEVAHEAEAEAPEAADAEAAGSPRRGWWQRTFGT